MILYFSGTGNSTFIAKKIAEDLQDELLCINDRMKRKDNSLVETQQPLVFVLPTYAWRIPRVVERWITMTEFGNNRNAYFIMTCGSDIGNAQKYLSVLCEKKNFIFQGVKDIIMPENYIALYDAPELAEAKQIIERAIPFIKECVKIISSKGSFQKTKVSVSDKIKSSIVNNSFYPIVVKADKFKADDKCTSCGKCVRECPLNNIQLVEKRPVWGKNCTHCMACICKCPVAAIEYGKSSVGKPRYQCPL